MRVDGVDVRDVTLASLADTAGLVAQETDLLHASIRENLLLAKPDARQADLDGAMWAARLGELVAGLPDGHDTMVGERGYRFSGGERQRLAIARMVLRNPPVAPPSSSRTSRPPCSGPTRSSCSTAVASPDRGRHDDLVGRSSRYAAFVRPRETAVAPADVAPSMS